MLKSVLNKVVIIAVLAVSAVFFIKYGSKSNVFYGDALGYYMYLPATFIYNNTDRMYELPADKGIDKDVIWYAGVIKKTNENTGKQVNQYTYGIAFMEMPFFYLAHLIEKVQGHEGTGYSSTYQYLIKLSSFFYALMGLILIFRILKNYFNPELSLLSIMLLFIGTNLFWFTLHQAGMSHIPLFFLYAMLMLVTIELHRKPKVKRFVALGLTMGLITIIRPTDILCVFIPLLYNVYNKVTLINKLTFFKEHKGKLAWLVAAFIIPIIPQMLYWKATAGSYLYYSYTGQYFSHWKHPKIIEGLFHFSNGWLPYSPIMIFSLLGFLLFRHFKQWRLCIAFVFPIYVYIIFSWFCYNYINGLGSRPMIHLYPLLAIPFAAFLQFIGKQKLVFKALFFVICLIFISINIGFSRLQADGLIRSEESNMAYNFRMFFKKEISYEDLFVRDLAESQPGLQEVTKMATLACNNFDDAASDRFIKDTVFNSRYFFWMQDEDYSPRIKVRYDEQQFKGAKWFRCSGKFMYTTTPGYHMHLLVLEHPGKLWKGCTIENKVTDALKSYHFAYNQPHKWATISYFVQIPSNLQNGDTIDFFVWNVPKTELFIDDLCLELYR